MTTRSIATRGDVLMFIALVPMGLWLTAIVVTVVTIGQRAFDLTTLMLSAISGFLAYLFVCLGAGGGALWALRRAKLMGTPPSRLTRVLSTTTAIVMVAPWAIVGVGAVARWLA